MSGDPFDRVIAALQSVSVDLGALRADVNSLKGSNESIARIVHVGNGQPPLTTRVSNIEQKMQNIERDVREVRDMLRRRGSKKNDEHPPNPKASTSSPDLALTLAKEHVAISKERWKFWLMLGPGLAACLVKAAEWITAWLK